MKRYGILLLSTSLALTACNGGGGTVQPTPSTRITSVRHFPFASIRASTSTPNGVDLLDKNGTKVGTGVRDSTGVTFQLDGTAPRHFTFSSIGTGAPTGVVAYVPGGLAIELQRTSDTATITMLGRGVDVRSARVISVPMNRGSQASGTKRTLCLGQAVDNYLAALLSYTVFDMMDVLGLSYETMNTNASDPNAVAVTLGGQTFYIDGLLLGMTLSDLRLYAPDLYGQLEEDVANFITYGGLLADEFSQKQCLTGENP